MSLKDKLYNAETIPPANCWEKIALSLDEAHSSDKFPATLYNLEIIPPAANWNKISSALAEADTTYTFPARLYDLEIRPPFNNWNKIVDGLDDKIVATPARRAIPLFLRYAAAAIFIGFAAFAIIRFTTVKPKTNLAGTEKSIDTSVPAPSISMAGSAKDANDNSSKKLIDSARNADEISVGIKPSRKYRTTSPSPETQAQYVSRANREFNQAQRPFAYEDHLPKIVDRYFMLLTPNGNFIRMSKKWGSLLCCVSGEEQDPDCKDQLQKWQEKIADSPIAPGPGNFMDILSLVSSLNEGSEL